MSDNEREKNSEGLNVSDKRRFNPDGTERDAEVEPKTDSGEGPLAGSEVPKGQNQEGLTELPEIKFADLILSFAGSAQMQLGLTPIPLPKRLKRIFARPNRPSICWECSRKRPGAISPRRRINSSR